MLCYFRRMMKMNIYKFARIVCKDLRIKVPVIKKIDMLNTPTQLGRFRPDQNTIEVKKVYENELDLYFAVAHELRHKYQIDYNIYDFENYKQSDATSITDYNLQELEIDANAYAYLVMICMFEARVLFNGFDQMVIEKIMARAEEILNNRNP